ncbi:MAG: tetratricopeptide repeat protein [Bryobacteraceae bacterium]
MAWEFLGNSRLFTNEAKLAKESYTHALALVRTAESRDVQREKSLLFVLAKSSLQAADLADADHYAKGWLLLQGTEKLQPDGYAVIVTLAKELFDSERYASAEPYLRRLLADPRSANLSSESLARVFLELAILCKQQGNLQDAVGLFQRHAELTFNRIPKEAERSLNEALKLQESIRGPRDPSLIPTLQSLALLNIHERQYERSSSLLDRSEAIIALLPAQDPILLATNLDGKGMTAKGKGDTESAASSYARAWTVLQTSASPPLKLAASILFNRGVLALEDNKVDDADQYFRKAMGLFEGAMANDAPPIEQLDVIAAFYLRKGRYEDAEKLFEKSLEVRKKIYGDRSLEYAWGLFSSANAYELRGDYSKAMNYDEKALALFTDVSGPETEEAHVVLNSLAAIYESSQKWEDAVKARERILQVNNAGKVSKQSQQEQLILLAQDYLLLRDYHQAVSARQRLVTLWEQEGLENPNYRDARRNLVPALEDAGKHEQAEQQFQTLRKLLHNRFWKDEIRLIADYANALARQKYTNEAAKLNEEAKAIQQKHSQSQ